MSFYAANPSPPAGDSHNHGGSEVDGFFSSAFHPFGHPHHPAHAAIAGDHLEMHPEKSKSSLDISYIPETLFLRGTGPDVEPAMLSGHVSLNLTESISIKQITLTFKGKARLPVPSHEPSSVLPRTFSSAILQANMSFSISLSSSSMAYSLCHHEWSFLEGRKGQSHTLKAGRHLFPFQLQVGGTLPSSTYTSALGGASIVYKLHAVAVRPGFTHHNLQAVTPINIVRSFSPEALEYQQTLEIENTWPEKLMYSIMIPHKAWAIGDKITALAKFSPLAKGARVLNVAATIQETTKIYGKTGAQENTRAVAMAKHEIVGHNAVSMEEQRFRGSLSGSSTPVITPSLSPGHRHSSSGSVSGYFSPAHGMSALSPTSSQQSIPEEIYHNVVESDFDPNQDGDQELNQDDVVTHLSIAIPLTATPTHTLEPIHVTHRIRWNILIRNRDGHTSELRCSLPIHLLDHRLLTEAQTHTFSTRRLLLGGPELSEEQRDEQELPSYRAHVYDRVANMYMPDAATRRITNPWIHQGVNPVNPLYAQSSSAGMLIASGSATPVDPHPISSHLPHAPGSGSNTPLEWVNSELLLSLSLSQENLIPHREERPSPPHSDRHSQPASRAGSNRASRHQSRTASPEPLQRSPASPGDTFVHSGSTASRNVQNAFQASMKPLSALSSSGWLSSRSSSHSNLPTLSALTSQPQQSHVRPGLGSMPELQAGSTALHRAFTEVPDYGVASRGFLGGVPPLTSMQGLPSYDEASRPPTPNQPSTPAATS